MDLFSSVDIILLYYTLSTVAGSRWFVRWSFAIINAQEEKDECMNA
jgi:hypothetical protein